MTRFLLILTALTIVAAPLSAQRRERDADREQRRQRHQELRAEIHDWVTTSVLPEVRTWQQSFDQSLSSSELADLQNLRQRAATLKESIHVEMKELRSSVDRSDRSALRKQMHEIRKKHRTEMREILDALEPIAKAHRDELRDLYDSKEDQIEAWREELRSKMQDVKGRGRHHRGGHDGLKMLMGHGQEMATRFLLWDGSTPSLPSEPRGTTSMDRRGRQLSPIHVSPNPSENTARVRMAELPNGPSSIEIFDMNGNLVRRQEVSVTSKRLDETISIDGLAPGTYMVSVNTPNGRRSETLVVTN